MNHLMDGLQRVLPDIGGWGLRRLWRLFLGVRKQHLMDVERRMELIVKKQGNTFTVNLGVRS